MQRRPMDRAHIPLRSRKSMTAIRRGNGDVSQRDTRSATRFRRSRNLARSVGARGPPARRRARRREAVDPGRHRPRRRAGTRSAAESATVPFAPGDEPRVRDDLLRRCRADCGRRQRGLEDGRHAPGGGDDNRNRGGSACSAGRGEHTGACARARACPGACTCRGAGP